MRKLPFLVVGACLLLSSQAALAVDGAQPYTFTAAPPQISGPSEAMLDAEVRKLGFEPSSDAGTVAKRWLVQTLTDPDWRKILAPTSRPSGNSPANNNPATSLGATLSPHERETVLRIFLAAVSGLQPEQCGQMAGQRGTSVPPNILSAKQLDALLTLLNSAVKRSARGGVPKESYSVAQALDADSTVEKRTEAELRENKEITASEMQDMPAISKGKHACIAASTVFRSMLEVPEPDRTVASWDFLSSPWHGTATQHVLQTAEQYAMSEFGLDKLPAQIAARLPAADSRPLAFRTVVVQGEWENRSHPEYDGRYRKTYWNLHNSGAVATFLSRDDADAEVVWGYFQTEFGFAGLKDQEIGTGIRILPPKAFPVSQFSTVSESNFVPQPNGSFRIPATQPSTDHVRDYQCETYGRYPASNVFRDLKGDAVDVSCRAVSDTGSTEYQVREAFLYDYGISVRLFEIDSYGLTLSSIRNVTVTR